MSINGAMPVYEWDIVMNVLGFHEDRAIHVLNSAFYRGASTFCFNEFDLDNDELGKRG